MIKVIANIIPKDYFTKLSQTDVVLNAIIRKTLVRLIEANKKTNQLLWKYQIFYHQLRVKGWTK